MKRLMDLEEEKPKLDKIDKKILYLLSQNSRTPLSYIAKQLQINRDTVNYRIKCMEKEKVIQGYYPIIDYKKLGYDIYHIFYLIDESDQETKKEFYNYLINIPNTTSVIIYSDKWDIEHTLIAKDLSDFHKIFCTILKKFPNLIIEKDKLAEVDTYIPDLFTFNFKELKPKLPEQDETLIYDPDEKDIEILKALGQNARYSTYDIEKQIKLSSDAIGLRIKNLYKTGIIQKFTIATNFSQIGYDWNTFAIKTKVFDLKNENKFETFIENNPNIIKAVEVFGSWDLLVYINSNGLKDLHNTIRNIKLEFANIIKKYETWTAYNELIFNPIPTILEDK